MKETVKTKRSARLLKVGTVTYISGSNPGGRGGVEGRPAPTGESLRLNMIGSSSENGNKLSVPLFPSMLDGLRSRRRPYLKKPSRGSYRICLR